MALTGPRHRIADDQKPVQLFALRLARFSIRHSADLAVIESGSFRVASKICVSCSPHERWHPVVAINRNSGSPHVADFVGKLLNQLIPLGTTENNVPVTSKMSKASLNRGHPQTEALETLAQRKVLLVRCPAPFETFPGARDKPGSRTPIDHDIAHTNL